MSNVPPEQPPLRPSPTQPEDRRFIPGPPPPPYTPPVPVQAPYAPPYPQTAPPPPAPYPMAAPGNGPHPYAPPPAAFPPPPSPQGMPPQLSPLTQKYLRNIPTFQNILQRELRIPAPLAYWIEDGNAQNLSAGSMISDTLGSYFGGNQLTHILTAHFKLPWHSLAELHVRLNRHGAGQYITLLYTATLGRPVAGEALLEAPKVLSWARFVGHPALTQKLNAQSTTFLKALNKFARTEETYGRKKIKISRFARLGPLNQTQSQLVIKTLPRNAFALIGTDYHFDAQEFLNIAATVESILMYP